jgi:hypothetical protein
VQAQLAGTGCPPSVETTVTITATDDPEGDAVSGTPVTVPLTCSLGTSSTQKVDVTYTAENCPGNSGPDQGTETGSIEITATIASDLSTHQGDVSFATRLIECKASN